MARHARRLGKRGRAVLGAAILLLLGWLLWPLSSKTWAIAVDPDTSPKDDYLAAERAVARRAGMNDTQGLRGSAPRIILIVADDLAQMDVWRYGAAHGAAPVPTPAIDSIGRDGATFAQAHATQTICAPSRAAILTGRYPQRSGFELQPHDRYAQSRLEYLIFRHGINTGHMVPFAPAPLPRQEDIDRQGLPATEITLAELLQARGFHTAVFGKWHLGYTQEFSPLARGFDEHYGFYEAFSLYAPVSSPDIVNTRIDDFSDRHMWRKGRSGAAAIVHNDVVVEEDEYLTFRFADLAAEYIHEHADDPFFLYLPFSAPHTPLQAPREYYDDLEHIDDPVRRTYAAMIAALDDAVDTVLDSVEEAGIADETLVIFTSDNGGTSYLGVTDNGPLAGGKFTTYQGGIAVPLMMRYPGDIEPQTVVSDPVSLLDIFPTVETLTRPDLAGARTLLLPEGESPVERPDSLSLDGVDLLPYLAGDAHGRPHEALYWRSIYNKAIRAGEWKLVITTDESPGVPEGTQRHELYNLHADPEERENVASQQPVIAADLACRLTTWEDGLRPPLWPPVMHFWLDIWGSRRWFAI